MRRGALLIALAAAVAGCAVTPARVPPATEALDEGSRQCAEILQRIDIAVEQTGVADGMAARVAGFPHLRVNRFLASYAREALGEAQSTEWVKRMLQLGTQGYAVELANLPAESAAQLARELQDMNPRYAQSGFAATECAARLAAVDLTHPGRQALLREAAQVPDEYLEWQRVLGLYWLTRIPFAHGIQRWHEGVREVFAQPLEALPVTGRLERYAPPPGQLSPAQVAGILARASNNGLGMPVPAGDDLEALFRAFAPEFEIDTAGAVDLPGALGWYGAEVPQVDPGRIVVYRRMSHTRHAGRVLLQLNYALWFPERPKGAGWDILGGHLDGLIWRVTLAPDGSPWVFDSIHHCGCYHEFFPTARARLRDIAPTLDETAFVPQTLPDLAAGARIVLRVAAGTHYLQRVTVGAGPAPRAVEYVLADDDTLRSLPHPQVGRRSAFRPDGIVPGSERDERYLFWPMGVPEPGAMRQWGRHATAFVGRRHFDDADLLERYFGMASP
ncbi:MAG: hypothetical protein HY527_00090 [Betaproteobacteria bacterium]|nr:hypothetical protein [Betaproteobacteria bacterium]